MRKLTRDELVKALRCCEDEDCMRCPVAYQPSSLCRGDVESHAADMLENHASDRAALVAEIEKLRKQLKQTQAERDAAITLMRKINWCSGCVHFMGLGGCADDAMRVCDKSNDHYQFRGPQKEA